MKNTKKGFTVVDAVIVVAVILILVAVLVPTFRTVNTTNKTNAALVEVQSAYDATVADELSRGLNGDNNVKTVQYAIKMNGSIIVESSDKTLLKITANEKIEVVTSGTATWKVKDGKLESVN